MLRSISSLLLSSGFPRRLWLALREWAAGVLCAAPSLMFGKQHPPRHWLPPSCCRSRVRLKGARAVEGPSATLAWQALYAEDQHGKARSMGISGGW